MKLLWLLQVKRINSKSVLPSNVFEVSCSLKASACSVVVDYSSNTEGVYVPKASLSRSVPLSFFFVVLMRYFINESRPLLPQGGCVVLEDIFFTLTR